MRWLAIDRGSVGRDIARGGVRVASSLDGNAGMSVAGEVAIVGLSLRSSRSRSIGSAAQRVMSSKLSRNPVRSSSA